MQDIRRHAPDAVGRRQDRAADCALSLGKDVDERLAIETERHRPPQIEAVEWRHSAVDQQVAAVVVHHHVAFDLRHLAFDVLEEWHRRLHQVELAGKQTPAAGSRCWG